MAAQRTHRVGVVADTHVGDALPRLPDGVLTALAGVDLIIHAGDVTGPGVLEALATVAPVVAVRGNHDRAVGVSLPWHRVVRVGEVRIGVTHGLRNPLVEAVLSLVGVALGRPVTLGLHRALLRRVGRVDCLVYGHYHAPAHRRVRGTLVFSPGAVYTIEDDPGYRPMGARGWVFRRYRRGLPDGARHPHVGVLEVTGRQVVARAVPVPGPLRGHLGAR